MSPSHTERANSHRGLLVGLLVLIAFSATAVAMTARRPSTPALAGGDATAAGGPAAGEEGRMAVLVVVAHVVVLILDDPARLALPDLRTAPGRARAGVIAVLGLTALVGTSVWRRWLALSYERWRGIHRVLITLVIAAAFAHVPWVDAYVSLPVVRSSVLGLVLAVAVALFRARVGRPRCDLTAWCRSGASAAMRSPCSSPPTAMTDCASNPGASPGCARRSARMASTTTRSR